MITCNLPTYRYFSNDVGAPLAIIIYVTVSIICSFTCHLLIESRRIALIYCDEKNDEQGMDQKADSILVEDTVKIVVSSQNQNSIDTTPLIDADRNDFHPISTGNDRNERIESNRSRHELITYADVTRSLIGDRVGTIIEFAIIILHILFATGLVICILDTVEDLINFDDNAYRYVTSLILLPLLATLSQITWLHDLWQLSAIALSIYAFGVIGCSLYSSTSVNHDGNRPAPDDVWDFRWDGFFSFTGTAVYALEGIGLVLPTAYSMIHQEDVSEVVCSGVLAYGFVTISYAVTVYMGGGGGLERDDDCDIVVNCIGPDSLKTVVQIMLILALIMTHPVFLFPATEMLEVKLTNWNAESSPESSIISIDSGSISQEDDSSYVAHETISSAVRQLITKQPSLRVGLVSISIIIGSLVTSFDSFSAFVGSILLVFAGFILPTVLYYKARLLSNDPLDTKMFAILAFIFMFGMVIMVIGGTTSFLDLIGY